MPATYSNGRAKPNDSNLSWFSVNVDWPYETVVVDAQTVTSREPNPLEWAIVRILEVFADDPPSLAEAAAELGIKDPVFLSLTLESLMESGVINKRKSDGPLDFTNSQLTTAGQAFLTKQHVNCLPEQHGMEFCFDAVTTAHVALPPRGAREQPKNSVVPLDTLPEQRMHIGLDLARKLAKSQNEPSISGQSKLTEVTVIPDQGAIAWCPHEIQISIDTQGVIRCQILAGTEDQQTWIDQLDFQQEPFSSLLVSSVAAKDRDLLPAAKPHAQWQKGIDRLISPVHILHEAKKTLKSARRQALLHSYWMNIKEVKDELFRAAGRGVHCTLFGPKANGQDNLPEEIEVRQDTAESNLDSEIAILADEAKGIVIDRVKLVTPSQRSTEIIVASSLNAIRVRELQQGLRT